jgi:allophanate hydrolase
VTAAATSSAPGHRPTARVRAAYQRIAALDRPEIWISLRPESDVLAEAQALETRLADELDNPAALPLAGVLVAVKDNLDVAGLETTAGCPAFAYRPEVSAPSVQRLVAAGALVLGKANLDQFATGLVGTRSPYGVVRNAIDPNLISGGSSSGSAVAVALSIADIGIGTDTAGSGRVPAALNGIVGLKPTLGLVSSRGMVPAARPYDCVSVFARTLVEGQRALAVMTGPDPDDPGSRAWPPSVRLAGAPTPRIAVVDEAGLAGCTPRMRAAVEDAAAVLRASGCEVVSFDIALFLDAASLLYGSALVAERFSSIGEFIRKHQGDADPTVTQLVLGAEHYSAHELATAQQEVRWFRLQAERILRDFDALLLPTTTEHPSIAEVLADPIQTNIRLGTYTNFVNLLDMAAVSVPVGDQATAPAGVQLVGPAFTDQLLLDVAALLTGETPTDTYVPVRQMPQLVVFGAHLRGQPLNHQLRSLGARYVADVRTAPRYRMVALPTPPGALPKPGIVADPMRGAALSGEQWSISPAGLGAFLAALPEPMRLGPVELDNGYLLVGFHCDPIVCAGGEDITAYGSWPAYLSR